MRYLLALLVLAVGGFILWGGISGGYQTALQATKSQTQINKSARGASAAVAALLQGKKPGSVK